MASITLKRTGAKMPVVGFGLWKVDKATCADTVYKALQAGYRLLDGAGDYGNEKEAGEGLNRAIKDGVVKREEVFVTSKLWNTFHKYEDAKKIAKYQLELWGIDYFDLFLVHFPIALEFVPVEKKYPPEWWGLDKGVHPVKVPMSETWKAMEDLCTEGVAKNIGISNCQGSIIRDILSYATIEPQVLQIELHPYLTQQNLLKYAKTVGLAVTAYSSFGPQSFYELGMGSDIPSLLEHNIVTATATKLNKSPAQVLLRWSVQQGLAVIPKSNNHDRLLSNKELFDFELPADAMEAISGLNQNIRLNNPQDIHPELAIFA